MPSSSTCLPSHVSLEQRDVADVDCANCGSSGLTSFYRVESIPAHSVLLMQSREEALNFPKRDLELGFCRSCGFIGNIVFDPEVHRYSTQYEETQGFSPTFSRFAEGLAQSLVDEYSLQGRSVLEIGCGKGEFLVQMCEAGAGRGIGIDPAYRHDRLDSPVLDRLTFFQEKYSEKHTELSGDFVCCRHTLEHIHNTGEFMRGVRSAIGDGTETVVFFEVPDIVRELRDGAFWDLYYEHCSYFSMGSLARLFRQTGFDVERLWLDFGDQYVMLIARPADGPTEASLPEENDLQMLGELVGGFTETTARVIGKWRTLLAECKTAGRRVALWGAGSKAVSFLTTLGVTDEVCVAVDVNPHKHDKYLPGTGHRTAAPKELVEIRPDDVIVMNPVYVDEIRNDLHQFGLDPRLHALD